jgi:hypothetical protein
MSNNGNDNELEKGSNASKEKESWISSNFISVEDL